MAKKKDKYPSVDKHNTTGIYTPASDSEKYGLHQYRAVKAKPNTKSNGNPKAVVTKESTTGYGRVVPTANYTKSIGENVLGINTSNGMIRFLRKGTIESTKEALNEASKARTTKGNSLKDPFYRTDLRKITSVKAKDTKDLENNSQKELDDMISKLNVTLDLPNVETVDQSFLKTVNYYNRFKVPDPNLALQRGYAHVFFVAPSCNVGKGKDNFKLNSELSNIGAFSYANARMPEAIKELNSDLHSKNDFMFSLSNATVSFSLNDEYIDYSTYGKTFTGYKVSYGKHNIESKTAQTINIGFKDDKNLNVYLINRLWTEYISAAYRGQVSPKRDCLTNKILDYAGAAYYIVTSEDGETIIFWSKYYGIFPTNIPSGQYSWSAGSVITETNFDIPYAYSWKADYDPRVIYEFNHNSRLTGNAAYVPVYDDAKGTAATSYVGTPYIESVYDNKTKRLQYKLRFRKRHL